MTHWKHAIGDDPLNRALVLQRLNADNAKVLAQFARESGPAVLSRGATAGGDERKLRGIPAIGRGVGGAIPGTRP